MEFVWGHLAGRFSGALTLTAPKEPLVGPFERPSVIPSA
jgi:hypothetical protein